MVQMAGSALSLGELTSRHFDEYVPRDPFDNVRYRHEMIELAKEDKVAQRQMELMCAEDPLFYINTFCYSYSPKESIYGDPRTPFNLYDFQNETVLKILECINKGMDCATPKSRGIGASWMCITSIEWCWHFRDFLSFLMVSRKQDLVDDTGNPDSLFWKVDFLHRYQPKWLLPGGRNLGPKDPGRKQLRLRNADNQSVMSGESTTGNIGVGGRHTAVFFDEFALQDDGYAAIRGSRDVTNCRIGNSTPRGQNHYYEFCKNIAPVVLYLHWSKDDLKKRGLYTVDDEGNVDLLDNFRGMVRFRKKGEKEIYEVMYPDSYPFQPCTLFKLRSPWFDYECTRCANEKEIQQELEINWLGSEYQFFDAEVIQILKKKYCMEPMSVGEMEYDPQTFEFKRYTEDLHGKLKLWMQLDGDGKVPLDKRYIIGCDVSAGTGASNSCCSVVDRDTGEKVGVWKGSHTLPHPFAELSMALAKWLNNAYLIWDASGPTGGVFTKQVIKHGYSNIYYRRNEKKIGRPVSDEPGIFLNPGIKGVTFRDYRAALADHTFINRSEEGMDECLQFICKPDDTIEHSASMNAVKEGNPDNARSAHGDETVADVLANVGLVERQSEKKPEVTEAPVGSLAWRMKQKRDREALKLVDSLGGNW